ncbi:MAG: hypothetical protein AAF518_06130 [Spirochaetota bacterium]
MKSTDKELRKKISSIKSPKKWVDFILNLDLNQQKKGNLTKLWLAKHKVSREDLILARSESKIWKERTRVNAKNRRQRIESPANTVNTGKQWTAAEIEKLKVNIDRPEVELVKMLKRSLQSINARKRLIRLEAMGVSTENTGKPWSKKELTALKKNIDKPAIELAKLLKRTIKSVQRQKDRLKQK